MDLTNQSTIKTSYSVDQDTNILTITIKDGSNVTIDTIEIENIKYEPFLRALLTICQERKTNPQIKGAWSAFSNTPPLSNTGMSPSPTVGDIYYISVSGTQDLGAGSRDYYVGTWLLYDGGKWVVRHSDSSGVVASAFYNVNNESAEIEFA